MFFVFIALFSIQLIGAAISLWFPASSNSRDHSLVWRSSLFGWNVLSLGHAMLFLFFLGIFLAFSTSLQRSQFLRSCVPSFILMTSLLLCLGNIIAIFVIQGSGEWIRLFLVFFYVAFTIFWCLTTSREQREATPVETSNSSNMRAISLLLSLPAYGSRESIRGSPPPYQSAEDWLTQEGVNSENATTSPLFQLVPPPSYEAWSGEEETINLSRASPPPTYSLLWETSL
ncbi:hypothetical protein [Candidatus Similichlamydia laticola]|uniref:Uncharacterized protein n=1 Tax=Candidatus Similichlamydia laticola TaxID=2170265 RepID=A0A369KBE4_9BACT|nr:hypothetical protein [Candidatus Similichlamydia laticola]RDB31238.1 hypothetical protein HAT2_00659 [Candidatus Similichlamydia laticola]